MNASARKTTHDVLSALAEGRVEPWMKPAAAKLAPAFAPRIQKVRLDTGRMKPTREDFKAKTAEIRAKVVELAGEKCERCNQPLPESEGHMHHTVGGSGKRRQQQSLENCAWICFWCHRLMHLDPETGREFAVILAGKRARRTP